MAHNEFIIKVLLKKGEGMRWLIRCTVLVLFLFAALLNAWSLDTRRCGDGTCDDFEKMKGLCPQDCGGKESSTKEAPPRPGASIGMPMGKCGDGVCDEQERKTGFCTQDCLGGASDKGSIKEEPLPADYFYSPREGFLIGFLAAGCRGLEEVISGREEFNYALELGVGGQRAPFWYLDGEFQDMCGVTAELIKNGFEIIANAQPMPAGPPADYNIYKAKLADLIKNKSKFIRYWQVGNEPDLTWTQRGYTAKDYVKFFLESAKVMRENCPGCKIVLAGISNQYDSGDNYAFYKEILTGIRKESSDLKPFDVFDAHLYTDNSDYKKARKAVSIYKQLLRDTGYNYEVEFVSTEFGTYSGQPRMAAKEIPFQSEEFQAEMLIKLYVEFFNAGIAKAFWADLINNYKFGFRGKEGGFFDLTGLIYHGKGSYDLEQGISAGTKKKAFYAYKTLLSKVQGKTKAEEIAENVFKFSQGSEIVYVAWSDTTAKLPALIEGRVKATDYLGNEQIKEAKEVILDDRPVFIETMQ